MPNVIFNKEKTKQKASITEGAITFVPHTGIYVGDGASATPIIENSSEEKGYYSSIQKLEDYLYEVTYEDLNYDKAYIFYASDKSPYPEGACSGFCANGWLGRNFDWLYSERAEFLVHTTSSNGRYATTGISSGFSGLPNSLVESGEYNELYQMVPFHIVDGINEYGLVVESNVVPVDNGYNRAIPTETSEVECSALMLPRFILDHFKTVNEAVDYLKKHVTIYYPNSLHDMEYELHFLMADRDKTCILEIQNNQLIELPHNAMTNFLINQVEFNNDGSVNTTETSERPSVNKITPHGAGLERYNLIAAQIAGINDYTAARSLLNDLTYTNAYKLSTNPFWYTEFVYKDVTVDSSPSDFEPIIQQSIDEYISRSRSNPVTWQTVHSVVYNIPTQTIYLRVQEGTNEYARTLQNGPINNIIVDGEDISRGGTAEIHTPIGYYVCNTAAAVAAKEASYVSGAKFSSTYLPVGAMAVVNFSNINVAQSPTLSLNGTVARVMPLTTSDCCLFTYNGAKWIEVEGQIYTATFGSSKYADIITAIENGKHVILDCPGSPRRFLSVTKVTNTYIIFGAVEDEYLYYAKCDFRGPWSITHYTPVHNDRKINGYNLSSDITLTAEDVGAISDVNAGTATDINGLLKGNGNTISKAIAGVDYSLPINFSVDDELLTISFEGLI